MAKLNDILLTPEVNQRLVDCLDDIPDDLVIEIGRSRLTGGFTKAKAIRKQISSIIKGDATLPDWLRKLLAEYVRWGATLEALSLKGIVEVLHDLVILHGKETVAAGLLLDGREELRDLGARLMTTEFPKATEDDKKNAKGEYCDFINNKLMPVIGVSIAPEKEGDTEPTDAADTKVPADSAPDQLEQLKAKNRDAQERYDRLRKKFDDARKRHNEGIKSLKKSMKDKDEESIRVNNEWSRKNEEQKREISELKDRIDETEATIDSRVRDGIELETSVIAKKWLGEARVLDEFLDQFDAEGKDVLDRVEAVLKAQKKHDNHHGTREELNSRLAELKDARHRLIHAGENALHPVPDLKEMIQVVHLEISRIEKRLDRVVSIDPVSEKVVVNINQAHGWDELERCRRSIEELCELELLDAESRKRLYHNLHRKCSILEDKTKPTAETKWKDSGWNLRGLLHRNQPCQLILDGHNIMYCLPEVFRSQFENGHPSEKARKSLIALTQRLVANRENVNTTLVFDGHKEETFSVESNFSYEFSGGVGEDRADNYIVDRLKKRSLSELDQAVFVVTDDRGLRARILDRGAKYVPVGVFGVFLDDFECLN